MIAKSFIASLGWVGLMLNFIVSAGCHHLTAAPKHKSLIPRDDTFEGSRISVGPTLIYIDESSKHKSPFAAKVTLNTTHPTIVLEDHPARINTIACTSENVVLSFWNIADLLSFKDAWRVEEFVVITSSPGCATAGYHQAYMVSTSLYDAHLLTANLRAKPVNISECTHSVHVEIGHDLDLDLVDNTLYQRSPQPVERLQGYHRSTALSNTTSSQTVTGTASGTYTFSSVSPSATTAVYSAAAAVDFSYINRGVIPPQFSGEQYLPTYPALHDVALKCINCTAVGQVELVAGGFTIGSGDLDELKGFLEDGYLEFRVNGFNAYMDMELSFLPGFTIPSFNAGLPPIPIGGLSIAGILQIGPEFSPAIPLSVVLDSPVDLFFGISIKVPDNSRVVLNFSDISSSYSTGFHESEVTMLPFNYTAQNLSLSLSAALQPALTLSASTTNISALGSSARGGIGVFVDMPMLSAEINHLSNATSACTQRAPGSNEALYESLINVVPSVEYGGGITWDMDVSALELAYAYNGVKDLANYTKPLPTKCLAFDKEGTVVESTSTAAAKSSDGSVRSVSPGIIWLITAVLIWIIY